MADKQVPVVRTVITPQGYARAVITAWPAVGEGIPEKDDVGVLYAQWMMETGGSACFCWNIGNAKWTRGCGFDYMCLNGVWEGVIPSVAAALVASGRAIRDPSPDHAKAVGPDKVSVIFPPPQPESRFRAFPDLATGMVSHLKLLHERFARVWPLVLAGDAKGAAHMLGTLRYFTANADVYGAGMQRYYDAFMRTSAYELALDEIQEVRSAETLPDFARFADSDTPPPMNLPVLNTPIMTPASKPTTYPRPAPELETGSGGTIHPLSYDVDPDDDVA